jgi:hypothetical protein
MLGGAWCLEKLRGGGYFLEGPACFMQWQGKVQVNELKSRDAPAQSIVRAGRPQCSLLEMFVAVWKCSS